MCTIKASLLHPGSFNPGLKEQTIEMKQGRNRSILIGPRIGFHRCHRSVLLFSQRSSSWTKKTTSLSPLTFAPVSRLDQSCLRLCCWLEPAAVPGQRRQAGVIESLFKRLVPHSQNEMHARTDGRAATFRKPKKTGGTVCDAFTSNNLWGGSFCSALHPSADTFKAKRSSLPPALARFWRRP